MGGKDRGPRPQPNPTVALRQALLGRFRWIGDRTDNSYGADLTGWFAHPTILSRLGPALAGLFPTEEPTIVLGPQSRGTLLGALVAAHLGVGLLEVRKQPDPAADSDQWLMATTPPDYRDRNLRLGVRQRHLGAGQRVLFVDDWIETGGQALGARAIVDAAGVTWCGAAVVVDGLAESQLRRELDVRSLLNVRDL